MAVLPLGVLVIVAVVQQGRRPDGAEVSSSPPDAAALSAANPALAGIDWNDVAGGLGEKHPDGRIDETSAYGRFLKTAQEMDGPTLLAAWDGLQAAGLPDAAREQLATYLIGTLLRKDPGLALNRFAAHAGEPGNPVGAQLFGGFREWSARSPLKAALWLDATVAAGHFGKVEGPRTEGSLPMRVLYERELICALLTGGPDQAAARLDALPDEWRKMALQGADPVQGQGAYAALVRRYLTAEEQEQEFVRLASSAKYRGGSAGVEELLDRIGATAAERESILRRTAGLPSGR